MRRVGLPSREAGSVRVSALDGLRGMAALVVLFHHCMLLWPGLADAYRTNGKADSGLAAWLTYTPLHLFWSGTEAVYLFFILSGFVLAAPWANGRGPKWRAYYPSRLVRLYLPIWACLALALVLAYVTQRRSVLGASWWLNEHATSPHGVSDALKGATVIHQVGWLNSALWSLRWEVLFSLLLPLYLVLAKRLCRWWPAVLAVLLVLIGVGTYGGFGSSSNLAAYANYLPMFGIGVLMAYVTPQLREWAARITTRLWVIGLITAAVLIDSTWYVAPLLDGHTRRMADAVAQPVAILAAAGVLFIVLCWRPAAAACNTTIVQWLGRRSFSLYLIHEPIVVTLGFALGGRRGALTAALAIPAALVAAELFFRFVERPCHRLSRVLRDRLNSRSEPLRDPAMGEPVAVA
jgi:peptidoglycan/LPS O-acetylase OafA/YrhL